jgi:hypothetical protein
MKEIIAAIYKFLGPYDDLSDTWRFAEDDGGSGMFWGFLILIAGSIAGAAWFYFVTSRKAKNAVLINWWKMLLYTALTVFLLEETLLAGIFTTFEEEPGIGIYFGNIGADSGKLVLFSVINAIYSVVIYYPASLLFCRFSNHARYIPHYKKNKKESI